MELLYKYINDSIDPECRTTGGVLIMKYGRLTRNPTTVNIPVLLLKKTAGEEVQLAFTFRGCMEMKVGIAREYHSFIWLYEKHLESEERTTTNFEVDISDYSTGLLCIFFTGLEPSFIYNDLPVSVPKPVGHIPASSVLYDFISPDLALCSEEQIFYKFSGQASFYSFEDYLVHLRRHTSVSLLTYFNAFSAGKWYKYTNVRNLSAWLDFSGKAEIHVVNHEKYGEYTLSCCTIDSAERALFELPAFTCPAKGILGIKIYPYADCTLYGGGWLSADPPTFKVRLGIGITSFRREAEVRESVVRLSRAITQHPLYHDLIDITVVDNGRTLKPEDIPEATLIPNKNLGGTGGFLRCLSHYKEGGKHTHCLFMDDDASCEPSSIFRGMSFMCHALDPKISLCGAMLFENIKFQQWENGAWFDKGCHSVNRDFDLRNVDILLKNEEYEENEKNEKKTKKRIYGAWWFFLFPIAAAKNYTLPFFLRGDDIDFSYANDFKVITLNGVSCWQQDFKTKENARTAYFFLRSHVMHHLTVPELECPFSAIMKILGGHFFAYNASYMYGTAACACLAAKHLLRGPRFWEENLSPEKIFKEIKELSACEQPVPYTEEEFEELKFTDKNLKTRFLPATLRKLSLNGHLLPKFMLRHTPDAMIYKWMLPGSRTRVYLHDQITVINVLEQQKTVLKRDSRRYFCNLFEFLGLMLLMALRYHSLRRIYREAAVKQRSPEFWEKQFK